LLHQHQRERGPKLFGTIGNPYVERFINYAIGCNDYWDWQELRRPCDLHHQQDVLMDRHASVRSG
jgi:hypothetical protein